MHLLFHEDGTYDVTDKKTGEAFQRLGIYEDTGDVGNEYMFKEAKGYSAITTKGIPAEFTLLERSALLTVLEFKHTLSIPVSADERLDVERHKLIWHKERDAGRANEMTAISLRTVVTLEKGWEPISRLGQFYNQLLIGMASSELVFEFLDERPSVIESPNPIKLSSIKGHIDFEEVEFSYDGKRKALNGVSLTIKAGETTAVGERQLLSFARALLADPKILILDESTASIDTETEVKIQKALKTLLKDRTAIMIAHRLSTIREADKIIVLDHGHILEQGNHDTLMAEQGVYYELVKAQYKMLG
ncbi:ABC-type glutathione transport system ATPase component [Neobacillus sp. B4I6]